MSAKVLFACSKCLSRHPFEELSSGSQLCKNCRCATSIVKCTYCRSEFQPVAKSQNVCKKCEHNLMKYGKPNPCECCKIVAAFSGSKCMRCASYEAKYGPPIQCDECKLRSAFDRREENRKINGKLLCWLCTCAYKRTLLKAQQDGRMSSKKRSHERSQRDGTSSATIKKIARADTKSGNNGSGSGNVGGGSGSSANVQTLDIPEKVLRGGSSCSGNGSIAQLNTIAAPVVISIDPNSADHVVAITTLKERIASLEKRLMQKDKELLEKDKLLTELKSKNYEKEMEMRNKLKEIDRLHEMKVENLNRKVASLLKEIAGLKKINKKSGGIGREKRFRENVSPKEQIMASIIPNESSDKDEYREESKENMAKDRTRITEDVNTCSEQSQEKSLDDQDDKESDGTRSGSESRSRSQTHSRSQTPSRSPSNFSSRSGSRSNSPESNL